VTVSLIDRRILSIVEDRLTQAPVGVLQGARSVGKSTVLGELARRHDVEITDLDDVAVRLRVEASPSDAVRGPSPVCIDEYQHVPELLQALKAELNRQHDNGRWLLTGSASFWGVPRGTQALTGRIELVEVMPFSQGELDGVREDFFDLALADPVALIAARRPITEREEYEQRVCRGGMPLAVHASGRQRAGFSSFAPPFAALASWSVAATRRRRPRRRRSPIELMRAQRCGSCLSCSPPSATRPT
jgi:predicted AAA+ superfamily ATPase